MWLDFMMDIVVIVEMGTAVTVVKTFPAFPFSPATATVATKRRTATVQRHGTTERRNGIGRTATEWWKPGIRVKVISTLLALVWKNRSHMTARIGLLNPRINKLLDFRPTVMVGFWNAS